MQMQRILETLSTTPLSTPRQLRIYNWAGKDPFKKVSASQNYQCFLIMIKQFSMYSKSNIKLF